MFCQCCVSKCTVTGVAMTEHRQETMLQGLLLMLTMIKRLHKTDNRSYKFMRDLSWPSTSVPQQLIRKAEGHSLAASQNVL